MDDIVMKPEHKRKGRLPSTREAVKTVIWAYYAENNRLPSRDDLLKLYRVASATADQAMGEVRATLEAAEKNPTKIKYTKAQESLIEARIKVRVKKIESEFEERIRQGVLERNKDYLARLEKMEKEARDQFSTYTKLINGHRPIFTEDQFKAIWACLHPDNSASNDKREAAFRIFTEARFLLTGKK